MELLERDEFLSTLDQYLTEVESAAGRVVLVGGEAGIGKTTLVSAFVRRHRDSKRVLSGACEGLFTPRALGPLVDMASEIGPAFITLLNRDGRRDQVFSTLLTDLTKRRAPRSSSSKTLTGQTRRHWISLGTWDDIWPA